MKTSIEAARLQAAKTAVYRHIAEQYGIDYETEIASKPAPDIDLWFLEALARAIENKQ